MNEPAKIDPVRAWMAAEALLDEEEAERMAEFVERMSDSELNRQMREGGYDPAGVPTVQEFLARGEARAAERERAHEASESWVAAKVIPLADRRPTRWALWLVAAMFGVLFLVMASRDPAVVALFRHKPAPDEVEPNKDRRPTPTPPTPQEQAEALRDEAVAECEASLWAICRTRLDEAQTLDPGGESAMRVQNARKAIRAGLNPKKEDDKPPKP